MNIRKLVAAAGLSGDFRSRCSLTDVALSPNSIAGARKLCCVVLDRPGTECCRGPAITRFQATSRTEALGRFGLWYRLIEDTGPVLLSCSFLAAQVI